MEKVQFYSTDGIIYGDLFRPLGNGPFPCVVINHGYTGNKEEYTTLAQYLMERNFVALCFDSQGTGKSYGLYGNLLCSTHWQDCAYLAVSYLTSLPFVDSARIGFAGCSMGGATALAVAAKDRRIRRIAALAPLSRGYETIKNNWHNNGRTQTELNDFIDTLYQTVKNNAVSGKVVCDIPLAHALGGEEPIVQAYLNARGSELISKVSAVSLLNSIVCYEPITYAPQIAIPTLVMHGSEDELIHSSQSEELFKCLNCIKKYVEIKGAPHYIPEVSSHLQVFCEIADWFDDM